MISYTKIVALHRCIFNLKFPKHIAVIILDKHYQFCPCYQRYHVCTVSQLQHLTEFKDKLLTVLNF